LRWLGDDVGAGLLSSLDQLVHTGLRLGDQAEDALAVSALCDLVVADDPAEPVGGNQHEADAVVESELERLRYAVRRRSPMALRPRPSR
jgi:hypothetical protein